MTGRSRLPGLALLISLVPGPGVGALAQPTPGDQTASVPASVDEIATEAQRLLAVGENRSALELLKRHRSIWNEGHDLGLLAARAYAASGNTAWAMRTMLQQVERRPGDCGLRAEFAWLMLSSADYRGARELLARPACPGSREEEVRWHLLEAMAARQAKEHDELRTRLAFARKLTHMYPEDRTLFDLLEPAAWPLRTPALELSVALSEGWRSNPLLGSPLDQRRSGEDYATFYTELDVWGRFASPYWGLSRLFLEGGGKGKLLYREAARDLSHAGWGVRPGSRSPGRSSSSGGPTISMPSGLPPRTITVIWPTGSTTGIEGSWSWSSLRVSPPSVAPAIDASGSWGGHAGRRTSGSAAAGGSGRGSFSSGRRPVGCIRPRTTHTTSGEAPRCFHPASSSSAGGRSVRWCREPWIITRILRDPRPSIR